MQTIQYKVRPVTRYIVTKYTKSVGLGSSQNMGEFNNVGQANNIAVALAKDDMTSPRSYELEVFYKLYSHDWDETEFENDGLIKVEPSIEQPFKVLGGQVFINESSL